MKKNILIGAQVFCWPKFINPLGQKSAFGRFLSCVGINLIEILLSFFSIENCDWTVWICFKVIEPLCTAAAQPWIFDLGKASSIYLWLFSPLSFSRLKSNRQNLPEAKTSWPSLSGPFFDLPWLKNMHGPPTFSHRIIRSSSVACVSNSILPPSYRAGGMFPKVVETSLFGGRNLLPPHTIGIGLIYQPKIRVSIVPPLPPSRPQWGSVWNFSSKFVQKNNFAGYS